MSAKQGVFGALLGLLNFSLKYFLLASSVIYVALASYHAYLEGSSYLGASLYILFFFRFFGLLLVPNSNPVSPSLRLLGYTGAKVVAFVLWACGIALLLRENYQDTVFLREVVSICMSACIFLILPVTHLEATGGDQRAAHDTALDTSDTPLDTSDTPLDTGDTALDTSDIALDTSDTVVAFVPSDQGRGRSICSAICRYWKKVLAIWFVLVCVCSFSSQPWEGRTNTSANGIMGEPTIVNNTTIVSDICLLPPELPTTASLTMPWIPPSTPAFITTLGTPYQVTRTRTQPSPVAKSTWVPAAMPTTMPTPEPTPTALPVVEPDPEPVPEPAPQAPPDIAAALQDVSDAFKLMVDLFTAKAKSILSPQAKSTLSWFLSLRVEDRWVAFALAGLLAWALFTGLVAVASVISGPAILPLTCLSSTGVFFCLQHYGVTRGLSLFICVAFCVVSIVALVAAAFLAHLLRKVKLLGSHAAEVPKVKADVSNLKDDLITTWRTFGNRQTASDENIAAINEKFWIHWDVFQLFRSSVDSAIGGLSKWLETVESSADDLVKRTESMQGLICLLMNNKADKHVVKKLQEAIEEIRDQLAQLKTTTAADSGVLKKELGGRLDALSREVTELATSLGLRVGEVDSALQQAIHTFQGSIGSLQAIHSLLSGICTGTAERVSQVVERVVKLEKTVEWLKDCFDNQASRIVQAILDSKQFSDKVDAAVEKRLHDMCPSNMRGDTPNTLHGTDDAPNGSSPGGHPQDPNVEPAPETRSDPSHTLHGTDDAPNGSSSEGHSQVPRGRSFQTQEGSKEYQAAREAIQGYPISPIGRVTDPHGRTVACVIALPIIRGDLSRVIQVSPFVNCNTKTGEIRGTKKPIARVYVPGQQVYDQWIQTYGGDSQDAVEDDSSQSGSSSGTDGHHDSVSSQSCGGHGSSSPPSSPAGPSSGGPDPSPSPGSHSSPSPADGSGVPVGMATSVRNG